MRGDAQVKMVLRLKGAELESRIMNDLLSKMRKKES